jgi:type IV pilus assembly protein PilO
MNEWLEDLLDKPFRQKAVILAAASLIVWGLGWVVLLGGPWDRVMQLRGEAREDRDRLAKLEAKAGNLKNVQQQVRELDRELGTVLARLPDKKEIPDLLNTVSELASQSGLRITKFRQLDERLQDYYAEVPVELTMVGTYHEVAAFFDRIPRLSRLINVTGITMKRPVSATEGIQIEVGCLATTFRFLDEKEREAAAKEREKKQPGKKT